MDLNDILEDKENILSMFKKQYKLDRLSHAYLFNGKKGTGKLKTALFIAAMLYCTSENKPCLECVNCKNILKNNHVNLHIIKKDNLSIKKEQILQLQDEFSKTPKIAGPRIYIIEEVEAMSVNASNSLLKFIEEPVNKGTIGILLTRDINKVLPTIVSRSFIVNFHQVRKSNYIKSLINNNINENMAHIISCLTNNINSALELYEDENIIRLETLLVNFLKVRDSKGIVLFLLDNKKYFENNENIRNFINLLVVVYEDLISTFYNLDSISFIMFNDLYKEYISTISIEGLKNNLSEILKLNLRFEYNVNTKNLLHQLLINLLN